MSEQESNNEMSFWDHIDEFRGVAIRIVLCLLITTPIVFFLKDLVFDIILAPHESDFILYRLFCGISSSQLYSEVSEWTQLHCNFPLPGLCLEAIKVELINTKLASQFMIHISTSIYVSLMITFPYIIYTLYGFVAPALYKRERRYSFLILSAVFILFICGVMLNYFLIFPLSFRFLAAYQVSEEIANMISLSSYVNTLMSLSLMMGIVFEIPILTLALSKFGLVTRSMLKKFRKHAFVAVMVIAAIITPTGDIITLSLVTLPMYMLYEFSLRIIK